MPTFWEKTKRILTSSLSKELLVFLFFLLLSATFWFMQTMDETLETEIKVPLRLVDIPEGVVITSPLPDQLSVTLRDKGALLLRYWRYKVEPLSISFVNYDTGAESGRVRIPGNEVQKRVQEGLQSSSRIQRIAPDTVEFYYNHGRSKIVPVRVTGTISADGQHYLQDVSSQPMAVKVYASAAVLDTLTAVWTKPVALPGLTASASNEVALRPIRGAKQEPDKVRVTATVDMYVENTIDVPIRSSNFPATCSLRTFPSTVQVTYTVGYAQSKLLRKEDFVILMTYDRILTCQREGRSKIPLALRSMPPGVANVRIEPQEVDYLIETSEPGE